MLEADREVEDGLVTFLKSQRRTKLLEESVVAAERAVKIVVLQYEKGAVDFNRYAVIEQNLVTQQDGLAQARGQIAQGLVAMYRAMGGGLGNSAGRGGRRSGTGAASEAESAGCSESLGREDSLASTVQRQRRQCPFRGTGYALAAPAKNANWCWN